MKISKKESEYLKGIAILLMLFHHLFTFPDRVHDGNVVIPLFQSVNIEFALGSFGKVCVAMFLFLSGYGFSISGAKPPRYYLDKIFTFYRSYWFILLIFAPIGWIFFSESKAYNFNAAVFLQNLFALSSSYNGEWWFVQLYILLVLCLPIINLLRFKPVTLFGASFLMFIIGRLLIIKDLDTPIISIQIILYNQFIFVFGYIIATYKENAIVNKITSIVERNLLVATILSITLVFLVNYFSIPLRNILSAFPFIIFCIYIKKFNSQLIDKLISYCGKHSMNMWLTHSFFCYYFFQSFIYKPQHSLLIFMVLVIVSLVTSIFIEYIKKTLSFWFKVSRISIKPF